MRLCSRSSSHPLWTLRWKKQKLRRQGESQRGGGGGESPQYGNAAAPLDPPNSVDFPTHPPRALKQARHVQASMMTVQDDRGQGAEIQAVTRLRNPSWACSPNQTLLGQHANRAPYYFPPSFPHPLHTHMPPMHHPCHGYTLTNSTQTPNAAAASTAANNPTHWQC